MNEKFAKLMAKRKGRHMDDLEKEAKMNVVKELGSSAADAMKERLQGLKKVTVASDSEEGLKKGLEKAEEIVEKMPGMASEEDEEQEMMSEDMEEPMSEEEIDAKLAELMAKKQRLEAKKA